MGIKANFNINDIRRDMQSKANTIVDASVKAMMELGEECVGYARENNGFEDETGNLVSSIGCKVFRDGRPVFEDYVQVLEGEEGLEKGRALADQIGMQCGQNQVMLVVTAGEEYAIFLESNGIDVLTGSEMFAREQWPAMKQRIDMNIRRQGL